MRCALLPMVALLAGLPWTAVCADQATKATYADHVRPILQEHCFACHGQDDKKSDLALHTYDDALVGGAGGEVLAAGDLESSRLWALVNHDDSPKMPPEQDKLPAEQLSVIKAWIEGGLLQTAGSKPKTTGAVVAQTMQPTADNRPAGEPALPVGLLQEPVVYTPQPGAVDALDASPWAPVAAVAGLRQASLYHTDAAQLLGVLAYPEGIPRVLRFSRDGSLLVVAGGRSGAAGNAVIFDVRTGARLLAVGEETDAVLAADISPDHSLLALGGPKKVVRVYRIADGSLAYEITKHTDWVTSLAFSHDGKLLATADRGGGLFLWDSRRGIERGDLRGHQEMIAAVSWRFDSQVLASASEDDTVRLWQVDGKQIKSWGAHGDGALSVRFARDGRLVTAGRDGLVRLWQGDGKHLRDLIDWDDLALAAQFTHDGRRVVASNLSGDVAVLDAETGASHGTLAANPPTLAMRSEVAAAGLAAAEAAATSADAALQAADAQLAAAVKAQADAAARREETQSELQRAQQAHTSVEQLVAAYQQAADKLTADSQQRKAEAEAAAQLLADAAQSNEDVQQRLAEHRQQIADLAAQLAQLQAAHQQLLASGEKLADQAAAQASALQQVQQQMNTAQQAADLAELQREQFQQAEALRRGPK